MKFHVKCKKIFGDGSVMAYDYNVDAAVKDGQDLVFHYTGVKGDEYTMTIPNGKIIEYGTLDDNVYTSQHLGAVHRTYRCYYFQWKEDGPTGAKTTKPAVEVGDNRCQQQGGLFPGESPQGQSGKN